MPQAKNCSVKLLCTLTLLFTGVSVYPQTDLKNSLKDLKTQFISTKNDTQKIKVAITISSFYLTNKGHRKEMSDSSRHYAAIAEALNNKGHLKGDVDAIKILSAKILLRDNEIAAVKKIIGESSGTLYCKLQTLLGGYYLEKPGEEKTDLDLAELSFSTSQRYADKRHMPNISLINQVYLYSVLVERTTDQRIYNAYFNKVLDRCRAYKSKHIEIKLLKAKAIDDVNHFNSTTYLYQTMATARLANETAVEAFCLKEIADYNLRQGNLDTAENQLNTVIKMYTAIGYKNLQFTYDLLAATAVAKGNLESAMRYSLAAVKVAEETGSETAINRFYNKVASICRQLGLKKQSLMWYRKWQRSAVSGATGFPYEAYTALATELISQGKARQVLKTLDSADRAFKYDANRMFVIPQLRADCYVALGQLDSAEYYNFSIIKNLENRGIKDYLYYDAYQNQATFYIKQNEFEKASPFVEITFSAGKGVVGAGNMAILNLYKFKIDSARGNYLDAINHFQESKAITDSIYNHIKVKQTEQLQLQYATAERDHENLVLRNRNNIQQSELEKEGLKSNLVTGGLLGSSLIICLLVYLYRAKQRTNTHLKTQQNEINHQNLQLNQLLGEKEWLIKEIHHRVKNNLQIISSLLNTQSAYLENEEALTAIRDSQNRMQAISIVHHKLYQSDDLATVNSRIYIEELVRSICDSFQSDNRIRFHFDIAEANLTSADTVPIGLILNEAITNSIKYAFADTGHPRIAIAMVATNDGNYQLTISDNGKGLPDDFDIDNCTSLGINLMVGLTEQLSGTFSIHSDNGTIIAITFPPSPPGYE